MKILSPKSYLEKNPFIPQIRCTRVVQDKSWTPKKNMSHWRKKNMIEELMDKKSRDLILAAEITALLHDLGKLRAEFAEEKSESGKHQDNAKGIHITEAHGAILEEPGRAYPETGKEPWLQQLKNHEEWAKVLKLPETWIKSKTVQAFGLGDAMRQHHATAKFPERELTLLGDIYTVGADWRDSALDKGSGKTQSGGQKLGIAFIADSFGNEKQAYNPSSLEIEWEKAESIINNTLLSPKACQRVDNTRQTFLEKIEPIFRQALGDTRRPTNDVSLWHHAFSTASLFKAAVAEGVLRQDFRHLQDDDGLLDFAKLGRIRFRLLGIRWDWAGLTQGALQPVVFTALSSQRDNVVEKLRYLCEVKYPIGNIIYEDDDGIVLAVGGFYQGKKDENGQQAETLFRQHIIEPLKPFILNALSDLGVGSTVRIAWTQPCLYLTDYSEILSFQPKGQRELIEQIGEKELRGLWEKQTDGQIQICPQCGIRPGKARELEIYQSVLIVNRDEEKQKTPEGLCDYCTMLADGKQYRTRWKEARKKFGFTPETFNLQDMRAKPDDNQKNARVVLVSVRIDTQEVFEGTALLTQVARPFNDLSELQMKEKKRPKTLEEVGKFLEKQILENLQGDKDEETLKSSIDKKMANNARIYIGDKYWLDFWKDEKDGRVEGNAGEKARDIVEEFFLREEVPEGLSRHTGDKLALFGMRKHASPGRLARIWDDLRQLWKDILSKINDEINGDAVPLSIDAQGFRLAIAAEDARAALTCIHDIIQERLNKVRAGFNPHVSALVFNEKFPLYVAFDAMRRMERRITELPPQEWQLLNKETLNSGFLRLTWKTPHGKIAWTMNLNTGDPSQKDLWYPHVICTSRDEGPGRIVHVKDLKEDDTIQLRPATFDFAVLEGTTRRYQLVYDKENEGRRYHFILGKIGRPPYLLEQMPEIMNFVPDTLQDWDGTRRKMIFGQVVEYYEKWVRDVPEDLQEDGRKAWHTHVNAILLRYLSKDVQHKRQEILDMLDDGRFFDAFEWADFVEKSAVVDKK